jgi:hypothetical protein
MLRLLRWRIHVHARCLAFYIPGIGNRWTDCTTAVFNGDNMRVSAYVLVTLKEQLRVPTVPNK